MSGPKVITLAPVFGLPAVSLLAVGGAVIVAAAVISSRERQKLEARRREFILAEADAIKTKMSSKLENILKRGIDRLNPTACSIDSMRGDIAAASDIARGLEECRDMAELEKNYCGLKAALARFEGREKAVIGEVINARSDIDSRIKELEFKLGAVRTFHERCPETTGPEKIRDIMAMAQKAVECFELPRRPEFSYSNFNFDAIAAVLEKIDSAGELLDGIAAGLEAAANQAVAAGLNETISKTGFKNVKTLEELFRERERALKPSHEEINVIEKVNKLLSELVYLKSMDEYKTVEDKYSNIKNEENSGKRLMLYDDLVIYCDGLVKRSRRRRIYLDELSEMKAQIISLDMPETSKLTAEIDSLMASSGVSDLKALKEKIAAAVNRDIQAINNEEYGRIIRSSFEELGYETDEGFETVLIQNKKADIRKPSLKNYKIRVVSNSAQSALQMEVVREVETEKELSESSRSQEIRDIEVETEFCSDYEKVIDSLSKNGVTAAFKMRKKPGEVKVKKTLISDSSKKSRHGQPREELEEKRRK